RPRPDRDRARHRLPHVGARARMKLFGRKPTLEEAVELIRAELRDGHALPQPLVDAVQHREPLPDGAREPPSLQELLDAIPGAAALLEVGARIVARNTRMEQLVGGARTVLEATRSDELADLCARGLAGWPHQRELSLPALGFEIQAQVTPLSHARALLVLRDLTAERKADQARRDFITNASHELRTPVTAISGATETLLHAIDLP